MSELPPGLDPDILERVVTISVDLEHEDQMRHRAEVNDFIFHSDEPESLGGDDEHPYPLDYFTAGVGL